MEYTKLGKTGIEVSRIGFGVLTVGATQQNVPPDKAGDLISYAMEQGINFFDTAQYYKTYPHLAAGLKKMPAGVKEPVIVSKCLDYTYTEMEKAIEEARIALNRDVIDIFLLHEVRTDGDFNLRIGAWEALQNAKTNGLVRAIGISTHHVDAAAQMLDVPECDVVFPLINKDGLGIRKGHGSGTPEEMSRIIVALSAQGKGIFAMKVFGGGNLTGSYRDCLNYVNDLPGIDSMMIGFGEKKEVDDAVDYIERKQPADYQPDVTHKKIHIDTGDCEGCGTCITRCPNQAISMTEEGIAEVNHDVCLTCGYCAPVCPVRAIIMW